jgi:heme/copper-type cytochrome/quinol oxidase subunit 2
MAPRHLRAAVVLGGLFAAAGGLGPGVGRAAAPGPRIEIQASRDGFRPDVVKLRPGETVRLVLTSADGEHCFAVDALRIEKRLLPGRSVEVDLTPDRAGTLPFYCCLETGPAAEKERGRIVVSD